MCERHFEQACYRLHGIFIPVWLQKIFSASGGCGSRVGPRKETWSYQDPELGYRSPKVGPLKETIGTPNSPQYTSGSFQTGALSPMKPMLVQGPNLSLGLQIAQSRSYSYASRPRVGINLNTLRPKVGIIYMLQGPK